MKHNISSAFLSALMVFSAAFAGNSGCNTNCNTNCTNTVNNCKNSCSSSNSCNNSNSCSFSCSNDCSSSSSESSFCNSQCGNGYVNFRSQGYNLARTIAGWQDYIHRFDAGDYGSLQLVFEYQQSFKRRRIAEALFGTEELLFQGSAVANRNPNAFLAENFGLPSYTNSLARFRPKIQNFIFEIDGFFGFDNCGCPGLYFEFHAPIVHTRWHLGLRECDVTPTHTGTFPACGFAQASVPFASNLSEALSGEYTVNGAPWLCSGRFPLCRQKKTKLAQIDLIVGYDFYNTECSHFGLYLEGTVPTGNRQTGDVFHPVVGNGHHFGLGVGMTGHWDIWNDSNDQTLSIWIDGFVEHLFKTRQCRLLDFCNNGRFSRYLALREFQADGQTPTGNLLSATCFNNRPVHVKVDVLGDLLIKLAYRWCSFGFDLGYELYGNSREKVRFADECSPCNLDTRKVGIAGSNGVCCTSWDVTVDASGNCATLEAELASTNNFNGTFSNATIYAPTIPGQQDNAIALPNAETVAPTLCLLPVAGVSAADVGDVVALNSSCSSFDFPASIIAPNSVSPQLVTRNDLNPQSAAACSVLTHKVFGSVNYIWADDCGWNPGVGLGWEAEFSSRHRPTLNQWGIWIKGDVSF